MANAIDERNLVANVQTGEAPGCTIQDLQLLVQELVIGGADSGFKSLHDATILTLMWHTFGRAIDTCFARKRQLTIATSGELFLQVARIKTSVVQGVSIFKATKRWEQCMLHALGVLFVGASEPSSYVFPLVPLSATTDLPGGQPYSQDKAMVYWESLDASDDDTTEKPAKRVRARPNVAKYINDMIGEVVKHATAYANGPPKLAIQWISTRGAWLFDSLTKVFAYVGTTTREDQRVGKVLAGYKDPDLPVPTLSVRALEKQLPALQYAQLSTLRDQLFRNVSSFADDSLNVSGDVLDAALASMLIHLEEVMQAVDTERQRSRYTSHYIYRFYEALEATNAALGCRVSMTTCTGWGSRLRASWERENFAQVGTSCGGDVAVLTAAIKQMLASLTLIERSVVRLTNAQDRRDEMEAQAQASTASALDEQAVMRAELATAPTPTTSSLAGCFYNWYTCALWETASDKKQQFSRADQKVCVNIMMVLWGKALHVPGVPLHHDQAAHQTWKQTIWTLAEDLNRAVNEKLIDGKARTKTAGSLRKRWSKLHTNARSAYDVYAARYLELKALATLVDDATPVSHQWKSRDFK